MPPYLISETQERSTRLREERQRLFANLGISEQPPPDAYDKCEHLVSPHFYTTPELTPINTVYTKYGNCFQKSKWRPIAIEAKAKAQRLYRKYGLTFTAAYDIGLYIAGSESDMQDTTRDRMMVLVFEITPSQIACWKALHDDAIKLLDVLGLSGENGVCVRYYRRPPHHIGDGLFDDLDRPETFDEVFNGPNYPYYTVEQQRRRQFAQAEQRIYQNELLNAARDHVARDRDAANRAAERHQASMSEAANALSTMMRTEEEQQRRSGVVPPAYLSLRARTHDFPPANEMTNSHRRAPPPPPYRFRLSADRGVEVNSNLEAMLDFYNRMARDLQFNADLSDDDDVDEEEKESLQEGFVMDLDREEEDDVPELTDESVDGSDEKDDGDEYELWRYLPLIRPVNPPPAIRFR